MSIELTDEIQHIIDQAMQTGLYGRPEDVVAAALQSLAEDWEDLATIRERAAEPRTALADLEAELRAEGNGKHSQAFWIEEVDESLV